MNANNIVKLAKIFDKFIELESSYVRVEDVRAIRKHISGGVGEEGPQVDNGIEVITPHGTFHDTTDFGIFRNRMEDAIAVLNEKEKTEVKERPRTSKLVPIKESVPTTNVAKPVLDNEVTLSLSGNGSTGCLFEDENFKIVNREGLEVLSPEGSVVAKGTSGGTIIGEEISGIVYETGKYTFAAKNYASTSIIVRFQMQRR